MAYMWTVDFYSRNLTYRYQRSHHFQRDLFQTIILDFQPFLSAGVIVFVALDIQSYLLTFRVSGILLGSKYLFQQLAQQMSRVVSPTDSEFQFENLRASKGDGLANWNRWDGKLEIDSIKLVVFHQPLWNICASQNGWKSSPRNRVEHNNILFKNHHLG